MTTRPEMLAADHIREPLHGHQWGVDRVNDPGYF